MDLKEARAALDLIDEEMAALLCRRMAVVDRIAAWKAASGMPVAQPQREQEVVDRLLSRQDAGCHRELRALYACIFELSRKRQEAFLGREHPRQGEV